MPTKKRRRGAEPPDFVPIPPGSMTDLELLPNLFRHFVATHKADFELLKMKLDTILERFDRLERRTGRNEERIDSLDRRVDDHAKRLERLEEARKGQDQ